jgi:hypothetical protein
VGPATAGVDPVRRAVELGRRDFPSGGAAVLDRETGLVWQRSPSASTEVWLDAQVFCGDQSFGNRMGWRLPTIQELASLVDRTVGSPGPQIPAGHPFMNVQQARYWSATTTAVDVGSSWVIDFRFGEMTGSGKTIPELLWCVRGGQGVDPQ